MTKPQVTYIPLSIWMAWSCEERGQVAKWYDDQGLRWAIEIDAKYNPLKDDWSDNAEDLQELHDVEGQK